MMGDDAMGVTPQELKEVVSERFLRDEDWPAFRDLEADLIDRAPLQEVIEAVDDNELNYEYPIDDESRVLLTLNGIEGCRDGEMWIERYLDAARLAGRRYLEQRGDAQFTNTDFEGELGLEAEDASVIGRLLWDLPGPLTRGGSRSNDDDTFQFTISPDAMHFRNVATLDEYRNAVQRTQDLRKKERELGGEPFGYPEDAAMRSASDVPADTLEQFHPVVAKAADRFLPIDANAEAVRISLQMFEAYVQMLTGESERSGKDLMAHAFRSAHPLVKLNNLSSVQDRNEQEGFMFLAMGAMSAFRNRYSHGIPAAVAREVALEQLSMVSLLFRKVEDVTGQKAISMGIAGILGEG